MVASFGGAKNRNDLMAEDEPALPLRVATAVMLMNQMVASFGGAKNYNYLIADF